jgi:type I restriction enzyme R subunit
VRIAPDDIRRKGKVPKNGSLFFTIFQTFMSGPPKDGKPSPYFGEYPPDFFDFIVIDECHRGGANDESNWRGILEYFAPAVQLGLTATPKRKDNVDTYAYFGEPVFVYSLKDGINDGFLTPFKVKQIRHHAGRLRLRSDDTVVEGEIEAGKRYDEADFNRIIEIKEREKKRGSKLFMGQIDQREKTLVFCATPGARAGVRDLINQIKTSSDPNYCQRVTANDGALGRAAWLRDFQDNEKTIPTILTTSQKLSTGVDARNIRNIVLMRPINSMIEFKQIIGRGTRLYDGKDYFTIYDFVKAHHHFSDANGMASRWSRRTASSAVVTPASASRSLRLPVTSVATRPAPAGGALPGMRPGPCVCKRKRRSNSRPAKSARSCSATSSRQCQFLEAFGKLFFADEDELRALCDPGSRKLLDWTRRASAGNNWSRCRRSSTPRTATSSNVACDAARAKAVIDAKFNSRQQAFLTFVLSHYVEEGVEELDQAKLTPLLKLRYHDSMKDALDDLGSRRRFGGCSAGFRSICMKNGCSAGVTFPSEGKEHSRA